MRDTDFSPEVAAQVDARSMGLCELCGRGRVQERHHRRPRGAGGTRRSDTNTAANALGLCRDCHRLIELNRTVSLVMGWLVPQNASPAVHSVVYRGERVFLTDGGAVVTT